MVSVSVHVPPNSTPHLPFHCKYATIELNALKTIWALLETSLPLFATSALRLFHTLVNLSTLSTSSFFWYPDEDGEKAQFVSMCVSQ